MQRSAERRPLFSALGLKTFFEIDADMRTRHRLKVRLVTSFTIFGIGLSALFAFAALHIRSRVEDQLVNASLMDDARWANEQAKEHPGGSSSSRLLTGMVLSDRTIYKAPLSWQGLGNGVHDVYDRDGDGRLQHYKLAVYRHGGIVSFLRYDVTREELGKKQLLVSVMAAVVLFGVLSLVLGYWLSSKVIKPVTDLAGRLRAYRKSGKAEPLAPHFADDEVGELARALDDYAIQLTRMVERDKEFNADVSHELRTPLAVIASTTELLQASDGFSVKARERLNRIERASRQAAELIDALLLLSRSERVGPTQGGLTTVSKVAADVIDSQRPQLRGKLLDVELIVSRPLYIDAPSSVLAVALTNLIGNAIKYTLEGLVTVEICVDRIEVRDTGPGIKAEDAERLFQRGVRGEGVGGSGAGLGLAIVRRLCDLYGWRVEMRPRTDRSGATAILVVKT